MGLEAMSQFVHQGRSTPVKALLESRELILRGAVRKTFRIADIVNPHAVDGQLLFESGGEAYSLALPEGEAGKWLKKLTARPPSLAEKLGLDAMHKAMVRGAADDAEVGTALHGATTDDRALAAIGVAIALTPPELAAATDDLIHALPHAALWVIYPKGGASALPEAEVRNHMRSLGYIDTKSCAVSDTLTATRFNPRKAVMPTA